MKSCFEVFIHQGWICPFLQEGLHMGWAVMEGSPVQRCHTLQTESKGVRQYLVKCVSIPLFIYVIFRNALKDLELLYY